MTLTPIQDLHPRAAWLLDGASITPPTVQEFEQQLRAFVMAYTVRGDHVRHAAMAAMLRAIADQLEKNGGDQR